MKKIFIDAGHGGNDVGAIKLARFEANDNLKLALKISEILKSKGQIVYLSRNSDKTIPLENRPKQANKVNADYFISIHRNSSVAETATGVETWVYSRANTKTFEQGKIINDRVAKVTGLANRGTKKGYITSKSLDYAVNRISKMPSCLIEVGFINNVNDNTVFDEKINEIAQTIADGICDGLGIAPTAPPTATPPIANTSYKTYKVKVGDSFWKIAKNQMGNGLKFKQLAEFNNLKTNAFIHPNDTLKIPLK